MLGQLLTGQVFDLLLVFVRVGAALMVLPGIGDVYVTPRIRLMLALAIALLTLPMVQPALPALPDQPIGLVVLVAGEILIGLFIGLIPRLLLTAIDIAGMIVSFNLSLANASVFNPATSAQGSLVGAFLTTLALVLIFVTDLHHLMLVAVVDSFSLFPVGGMPPSGDLAEVVTRLVARSFTIGVQIAAPFIVIGLIFYLGLGLIARLMPQVQIFFVAIPIQVMLGLLVMSLTLSAAMLFWLRAFQDGLAGYLRPL